MTRQAASFGRQRSKRGGFALVTVVLLVALLASTGVGLAQFSVSHRHRAIRSAATLDHEMAVESFLVSLPHLKVTTTGVDEAVEAPPLRLQVGSVSVQCRVTREKSKTRLSGISEGKATADQLRRLASEHELPVDHVLIRPVVKSDDTKNIPALVSFDQIVRPTGFEEVYHREPIVAEQFLDVVAHQSTNKRPENWSDLVTFWQDKKHDLLGLTICTKLGTDQRWWYVVCYIDDGKTHTVCRLRV